jgi:hypothetical protein
MTIAPPTPPVPPVPSSTFGSARKEQMGSGQEPLSGPAGPGVGGGRWTDRRRRLQAALGQRDELFADLYGRAIDALSERPVTRGSLVIAGHCIRDVVNGLPDVLPTSKPCQRTAT